MTQSIDLPAASMLALSRESLAALRTSLFRDFGGNAAGYLHEAGYAGAGPVYAAFETWLKKRGGPSPADLALDDFAMAVGEFFAAAGWGRLGFSVTESGVARIESSDWAESVQADGSQPSGCYFTTGILTDFFARITDAPVSVMETECRSMGSPRCVFLVGTPAKLQSIYEEMVAGG